MQNGLQEMSSERSRLYPAYFPLATTDTQAIDEAYRVAHGQLNK